MNILIADDHELVREGLCLLIKRIEPKSVIFMAGTFSELEILTEQQTEWGLILVDLTMPGTKKLQAVKLSMAIAKKAPVIIISASDDNDIIKEALTMGVKGYIPKSATAELMANAINLVLSGGLYFPESILDLPNQSDTTTNELSNEHGISGLTKRQSEVALLLTEGKANKEIGRDLNMSEATVRTHMTAIFRLLEVDNRTKAVIAINKLKSVI